MQHMLRSIVLSVAGFALVAGGIALRGESTASVELSLSPAGAVSGKTLTAGEAWDMTVHLQGQPDTTYDFAVVSDGTAGSCPSAPATLTTNPEGKATWTCDFATAGAPGAGTVTFTVSKDGGELGSIVANLTVVAAEEEEEAEETEEPASGEAKDNHGACVSYWTKRAKAEGLEGRFKGQFTSMVARSDCTGVDESEFADELAAALQQQETAVAERAAARAAKQGGRKAKAGRSGK